MLLSSDIDVMLRSTSYPLNKKCESLRRIASTGCWWSVGSVKITGGLLHLEEDPFSV